MLDGEGPRNGDGITLTAPCTGTVVRLLARSVGAVVAEGDVLAEIVCAADRLQVELSVPQRGFALVAPGQPVKLQYDAFPFERYGVRYATLRWMSPTSTPYSPDGTFRALADLGEEAIHIGDRTLGVRPGMRGRASIVVGRRSLASYALEPFRGLRERASFGPEGRTP
jgi:multidrug efflux pump subunit AcrA (membrane-fusion protein)